MREFSFHEYTDEVKAGSLGKSASSVFSSLVSLSVKVAFREQKAILEHESQCMQIKSVST